MDKRRLEKCFLILMSHDLCCNIRMAEFCVNNMKGWIRSAL